MVMIFAAIFGFCIFPTMPTMMELLTRKYPDVPLHISNTFLVVSSQLVTVLLQYFVGEIFDRSTNSGPIVLLMVLVFFSTSLLFVVRIDEARPNATLNP